MRLLGAGAWVLAGKMLAAAGYILLNAFLAKTLSPEDVGHFFVAFSVVSAAALLGLAGTNHAAVRFVATARLESNARGVFRTVLRVLLVGAAGLLAAGLAVHLGAAFLFSERLFGAPRLAEMGILLAAWIVFAGIQLLVAEAFRGLGQIPPASAFGGGQVGGAAGMTLAIAMIFAWYLVAGPAGLVQIFSLIVVAFAMVAAVGIAFLLSRALHAAADGARPGLVWQSAPLGAFMLVTVSQYLFQQADLWVVGIATSVPELAVYGSASRLVFIVALPLMVLNGVLPTIIVRRYHGKDLLRLEQILRASASLAALVTVAVLAAFAIGGEWLLTRLFTADYADGVRILIILGAGRLVSALAGSCSLTLMMTGHQRVVMSWNLVCGIGCVAVAFPVARFAGPDGVAWVFASVMAIQNVVMAMVVRRRLGIACHAGVIGPGDLLRIMRSA